MHCGKLARSQNVICKPATLEGPCECRDSSSFLVSTLTHTLVY